ncbi:MAG TPA: hypothetical protein VGW78_00570 [Candidatus Babeliales bacterium]|jgi:hypothetical protein|nr:hypothetical protein [Candidatus Babeliales bacterium]
MKIFIVLLCCIAANIYCSPIGLLIGKIVFPLSQALTYELTYGGQKITTEIDGSTLIFRMPINKHQQSFFLLFIEDFDNVYKIGESAIEQKTVDYQIARAGILYHFFELQKDNDAWIVAPQLLPDNGRIPDNTIIVRCPADYLKSIEGGSYYQLPTIVLKDNIIELAGSEEQLQEKSVALHMASLDIAPFYEPMKETKKLSGNRILIVPTA